METAIFATSYKTYHIRNTRGGNFKVLIKEIFGSKGQVYTARPVYGFKTEEKAREFINSKAPAINTGA